MKLQNPQQMKINKENSSASSSILLRVIYHSLLFLRGLLVSSFALLRGPIFIVEVFILPDPRVTRHVHPLRLGHTIELR